MPGEKRALVLAPHQDDELNIAGQILPTLIELGYRCTICFSTDGNANGEGPVRAQEALRVAALYGVASDDVAFLNHPELSSVLPDHPEMSASRFDHPEISPVGAHSVRPSTTAEGRTECAPTGDVIQDEFSKLLRDLINLFERLMPDVVICIDFDWHPDHRLLSLASEDALGDVMRRHAEYRPVFLKKFAYAASWDGPTDYYTFSPSVLEGADDLDNPTLFWDERISLLPHPSTLTAQLGNNIVYRAFRLYESQRAWPKARSVCNADVAYWPRRTDDLCLSAQLAVSSGDASALLDFKRFNVNDVFERNADCAISRNYGWKPAKGDDCPLLLAMFKEPVEVSTVECYWTPGASVSGDCVRVLADGELVGFSWYTRGCRLVLTFDVPVTCTELALAVPAWPSDGVRLTSFEAYPRESESLCALDGLVANINAHGLVRRPSQWGFLKDFLLKLRVFFYYKADRT